MEENVQRVFSVLIAVVMFFFLPMYMTFEKKDDVSYALALKITSNFVDNVSSKGYISRKMYDDFSSELGITDNSYEISIEHVAKKYVPAIYIYDNVDASKLLFKLDYKTYESEYIVFNTNGKFRYNNVDYTSVVLSYDLEEERITCKQIMDVLDRTANNNDNKLIIYRDLDNYSQLRYIDIPYITNMYGTESNSIYTMSVGDEFNVIIKNTNTTIASVLFNTFTMGISDNKNPKIYINYGATIKYESYKQ